MILGTENPDAEQNNSEVPVIDNPKSVQLVIRPIEGEICPAIKKFPKTKQISPKIAPRKAPINILNKTSIKS